MKFESFTIGGGNMSNQLPKGKEEVFSIEKYIEYWYGKNSGKVFSETMIKGIEDEYLLSNTKNMVDFCNKQALLEGTDGGD